MLSLTFRNLVAHRRRLVGTGLAIVLGVSFLAASLVMGDTMRSSFGDFFDELTATSDVVVRRSDVVEVQGERRRGPVPADLLVDLEAVDGVVGAALDIEGAVQLVGPDGEVVGGNGPPVLGQNWIEDPALNPMTLREGRAPEHEGEIAVDRATAHRAGLAVGGAAVIHTPAPAEVRLVGLFTVGDLNSSAGTTFVAFDTETAARTLGRPGEADSIRLRAADGLDPSELRDRVAATLEPGHEAITGAELANELRADIESDFVGIVDKALLLFAGIALVVAAFSIHNTFAIVVAQRSRESALLRALGASRRQVLASVTVEALAIGVVAAAIGVAVGIGLAAALDALLTSGGMELPGGGITVTVGALAVSSVVGVMMTLLSSVMPSIRASRVAPIEALRDLAVEDGSPSRARTVAGVALTVVGLAMMVGQVVAGSGSGDGSTSGSGSASTASLGALLTVVGVLVLGPIVARPITSLLGAPFALTGGASAKLARRNATRNPRRTAGAASALLVGVSIVALMATVGASMKTSIEDLLDRSFGGDLVIDPGWGGVGLEPDIATEVAALDEVATAAGVSSVVLTVDGRGERHLAADPAELATVVDLDEREGTVAAVGPGEIAIGTRYADLHDLDVGDTVTAGFVDGDRSTLRIAAVYGVGDLMGDLILHEADWHPHADADPALDLVLVELADGVDPDVGQRAVQAVSDAHGGPEVENRDQYLGSVASEIDQLLFLVYGMLGLAVLIALMGIANTLSLSIHERTRELGLLRAVGQTRAQMRTTVRGESVITAVFGTLGGLGVGTFLGWALVRVVTATEGFGIVTVPTGTLVAVAVISVVAGIVAAIRPARCAARLDVLAAIAGS